MTPDTPLPEVAKVLSAESAKLLMYLPVNRQWAMLSTVRRLIVGWEGKGVVMDPLTLSVVLTGVFTEMLGVLQAAAELVQDSGR